MAVRTNIVVITYNALNYTKATINSLFEKTSSDFNLTIVDNGSKSDTINYLDTLQPARFCKQINLIKNSRNTGVGHAYSQGQQVSFIDGVEFTAFCNNDLYCSIAWLAKLENRMDENQNVAMLSPLRPSAKIRYNDKISTRDRLFEIQETDNWKRELESYTRLTIKEFDRFTDQILQANGSGKIELIAFPDSLSTCVCLTRNSMFRKVGHFADSRFVDYGGEDIDMSWTIMSMGYDCAVDHGVYVHHFRGKSLKSNNMKRQELLKQSNRLLYDKWKNVIQHYIKEKRLQGIDIAAQIKSGQNSEYWLLFELNKDEEFLESIVCV